MKLISSAALIMAFAIPAYAGPPDHAKDKAKKHDRNTASHSAKKCPPGLADKGCIPPGQVKKYQLGQPLPIEYGVLRDYRHYDLQKPRRGYYYSKVGQDILLVSEATRKVAEIVTIIDILAD